MVHQNQRQITLLLTLAALGAALIFLRLSVTGGKQGPVKHDPLPREEPNAPHGKHVFGRRIVAVGDLHGGKPDPIHLLLIGPLCKHNDEC